MKQYTTPEQTAKLIELGLVKPNSEVKAEQAGDYAWFNPAYSIGELIEMLPMFIDEEYGYTLSIYCDVTKWIAAYDNGDECSTIYATTKEELVDALFGMIVKLKEEGEI